jgi:hypothetical protein
MSKINRDELVNFVGYYLDHHQRRPTAGEIAARFGVSSGFAGREAKALLDDPDFFTDARRDHAQATRSEVAQRAMRFIAGHIDTHGWAPSQRELAEALGCSVQHANATLNRLEADGLIVKGPQPRQIRIVASAMKSPEYRL